MTIINFHYQQKLHNFFSIHIKYIIERQPARIILKNFLT